MLGRHVLASVVPFIATTAVAATALADAPGPKILPKEDEIKRGSGDPKPDDPWDGSLLFGLQIALATSNNVVGQPTGLTVTGGLNLEGGLSYMKGPWDWQNALKVNEIFSRTPVVDQFVKSGDVLSAESTMSYHASKIFGPFASLKLDTSILAGFDVRPAPVDYLLDGLPFATGVDHVRLTDGFQPLSLKEALGVFVSPSSEESFDLDLRAGFGAVQTFAEGGKVVSDDGATPTIELTTLHDVSQAGIVVGAEVKGVLDDKRVLYAAHAEVMFPVVNDDPQERDAIELTNVDIGAKLGFKLFEYASLDYELKIIRQPQLVDVWQISNSLLLTFSYKVIE